MADFDRFLEAAHGHGLRVISDFVMNHTSDQHPWFQAARRLPDSPFRDYYVWSDTDQRYRDARIIFLDTEASNWTWDPVAKAYYWHRFFHHQPDLNFDNPAVRRELLDDDALLARQGLRRLPLRRRAVSLRARGHQLREPAGDARVPARGAPSHRRPLPGAHPPRRGQPVARPTSGPTSATATSSTWRFTSRSCRASSWPSATGTGGRSPTSSCTRRRSRRPCQWCLFLRNHDELTLEMVSEEERRHLYHGYGSDPRMRLNLGIRRRLAPLLDNDRRKIELLTSLLFTLPGQPDPLLRRRDRHGRQHLPRRPQRRAHARCSGRATATRASPAPTPRGSTCR